ncbi:MAG TPA: hypothetical protein PLF32_10370 [Bacteroidales bacterium]|jgi:hypothetical protein|nr:hypothetical protein [Bacteroidales bacterium]
MKILFVINNGESVIAEYIYTGVLNAMSRRAVEIELTPEQIKKLGIRKIGKDLFETIESISLSSDETSENSKISCL